MTETSISERLKNLIVTSLGLDGLEPSEIADDAPLFGEGLGLDSVDALELVVAMEKEFGFKIQTEDVGKDAFQTVATLTTFVQAQKPQGG